MTKSSVTTRGELTIVGVVALLAGWMIIGTWVESNRLSSVAVPTCRRASTPAFRSLSIG